MQTVNFPCSHCGNLMAVGMELLGRHVRCPHCRQVVLAPTAAPAPAAVTAPAPAPAPKPPSAPTFQAAPEPFPQFHLPANNEPESIFTEHVDEDLFGGTRQPRPELPPAAPQQPAYQPPPQYQAAPPYQPPQTHFATYPPEAASAPAPTPFQDFAPHAPAPAPYPQHYEPAPAPPSEAFPHFTNAAAHHPPAEEPPTPTQHQPEQPSGRPGQRGEAPPGKGPSLLITILVPYAILATGVIIYLLVQLRKVESVSPLETIPDIYGEYEKADRKAVLGRPMSLPNPTAQLPERLTVAMGKTVTVGDLEVTPERIEQKKIKYHTVLSDSTQAGEAKLTNGDGLILTLRIKNRSEDVSFAPTDPAFNRYFPVTSAKGNETNLAYTYVEIGAKRYYGSAIPYPWQKKEIRREYVEGQQDDPKPLKPHEERRYVVTAYVHPDNKSLLEAVKGNRGNDPMVWRVQLRRGLVPFSGHDIGVSAVIGVKFQQVDVRKG